MNDSFISFDTMQQRVVNMLKSEAIPNEIAPIYLVRDLFGKVFLRFDQVDQTKVADFPDASKVLSSAVELNWPRHELYGLLWHYLANGPNGADFRKFLTADDWQSVQLGEQQFLVGNINAKSSMLLPANGWDVGLNGAFRTLGLRTI